MIWTPGQESVLQAADEWIKYGNTPVFRLFGYAGTGKTTLAKTIAESVNDAIFASFTGKAAHVMRQKGCDGARTIHGLIYRRIELVEPEVRDSRGNIITPEKKSFYFELKNEIPDADLIIIDECSMVDARLGRDLLSFGIPVLVLGDPAQLPPVYGAGFFTGDEPDAMLTEIHRQAADNPIIRMATTVREGGRLHGTYGTSRVTTRDAIDIDEVASADQVLAGLNKTRRGLNRAVRDFRGLKGLPSKGDRLVRLRNDHGLGLMNGSLWNVTAAHRATNGLLPLSVTADDDDAASMRIDVSPEDFNGKEPEHWDFGNALTVHKAQGSEWNDVVLFDESSAFSEHRNRWLYTGITRAAEQITVVRRLP
jgi:exodeoxyribonuclease-5